MVRLVLLGPPGTGKGTQAELLAKKFRVRAISVGQLLRDHIKKRTKFGILAEKYVVKGYSAPDKYVIPMVKRELKKHKNGFILDDFPRTMNQLKFFDKNFSVNYIVFIDSTKKAILARLKRRRKIEGRDDDKSRTIRKRLVIYNKESKPVINYYKKKGNLIEINGSPTNDDKRNITLTFHSILAKMNRKA